MAPEARIYFKDKIPDGFLEHAESLGGKVVKAGSSIEETRSKRNALKGDLTRQIRDLYSQATPENEETRLAGYSNLFRAFRTDLINTGDPGTAINNVIQEELINDENHISSLRIALVLTRSYGLGNGEPASIEEIARDMNYSESSTTQLLRTGKQIVYYRLRERQDRDLHGV